MPSIHGDAASAGSASHGSCSPNPDNSRSPWAAFGNFFEPPDVTVIGSDGKHLVATYVGLDAVTGLSILKLAEKNPAAAGAHQGRAG